MHRFVEKLLFLRKTNLFRDNPSAANPAPDDISGQKRPINFHVYDDAYKVWKKYRTGTIDRQEALKQIGDLVGIKLFFFLYPLYKIAKPFVKLKMQLIVLSGTFYKIHGELFGRGVRKVVYISGEPGEPGNLYRVTRYAQAVSNTGARAVWIPREQLQQRLREIAGASLLIIWRAPCDGMVRLAVKAARNSGARVVFDVDDLLFDPEMARVEIIDAIRSLNIPECMVRDFCKKLNMTMLMADICTASTEELAARLRRFNRPAVVLTNGFDQEIYSSSRLAVRTRRTAGSDGLVRIGYAAGTRTHQRDFASALSAIVRVLDERPFCRLVLFRNRSGEPTLDPDEFNGLGNVAHQIEWRAMVAPTMLPYELARFDINIAPLETGNPYCEAKSELKFFEAALVDVPTVASPTGPFRRAIRHGITGYLAAQPFDWRQALIRLVDDPGLRKRIARQAHREVLWTYGPLRRVQVMKAALPQLCGEACGPAGFSEPWPCNPCRRQTPLPVPESEVLFENDKLGASEVTVILPVSNGADRLKEVCESVRNQTLEALDLIIVVDKSTDGSLDMAQACARASRERFNRIVVLRSEANSGMGALRNIGFDAADTRFVVPLSTDNLLFPEFCAASLRSVGNKGVAFAYTLGRRSGDQWAWDENPRSDIAFSAGPDHDGAVALIAKEAWAAVGGYGDSSRGREELELLSRLAELGLWCSNAKEAPAGLWPGITREA